ncbi:MAG: PfkB family carbohydrate kinase [Miltoncostaeaceae bacterium]
MTAAHPPGAVAVVGHVEWVTHALGTVPGRGHIADLSDPLTEPAGGGAVAACAAARLGAVTTLVTALGEDEPAARSRAILEARGVQVIAAGRTRSQTPVLSITEPDGERTIMVVGARLQAGPDDPVDWKCIGSMDAAYYAGEHPGALVHARRAASLVVTARRLEDVRAAGVRPDVIVASAADPDEDPWGLPGHLAARAIVVTDGSRGGSVHEAGRAARAYDPVAPPGPLIDSYGCGDSFAAGIAVGLARGLVGHGACTLGAVAGARCATWRGGLGPAP